MRESRLERDPEIEKLDMQALVGIAAALENESVERYAMLAELMTRRGEVATAAAFEVMCEEERAHVDAVAHWAEGLAEPVPPAASFAWTLPADLAGSWDEIAGSALLTPYRAFALAVENEQRAFSFYTYLAARATDERVMAEAERLAGEELRHAMLMRRWRREAYHRARAQAPRAQDAAQVDDIEALHRLLEEHEAAIGRAHRDIADRLRRLGDDESAELLDELLAVTSRPASSRARSSLGVDRARQAPAEAGAAIDQQVAEDPVHLLVDAQKPLERFGEALEAVMRSTEGALFAEAERAIATVVKRLARVSLQTARRMRAPAPPKAPNAPDAAP